LHVHDSSARWSLVDMLCSWVNNYALSTVHFEIMSAGSIIQKQRPVKYQCLKKKDKEYRLLTERQNQEWLVVRVVRI
jgi:hypothetical protein